MNFISVLVKDRGISSMDFFHNAIKLRKMIVELLLRDFGIKDKIRNPKVYANSIKMSDEDKIEWKRITEKYQMNRSVIDEYPKWLIIYFRENILLILRDMIFYIVKANSIYIDSELSYKERRHYQTLAICQCEILLQEFQFVIDVINVDVNKFMPYVELIEKEIALLKGWRKSDNKVLRKLKEQSKDINK